MKLKPIFLFTCLVPMVCAAQEAVQTQDKPATWTLKSCIEYARANNLDVRRSRIDLEAARENIKAARAAQNPSLSFSANESLTNTPFVEQDDKTSFSGNYSLQSSLVVYQGGKLRKNKKLASLNESISQLTVAEAENNLELSITEAFVQVLYADEAVRIGESTVEKSEAQVARAKELLDVGMISKVDYSQLTAQLAQDKYSLVTAQTSYDNYVLQLKLLLQLGVADELVLDLPDLSDADVLAPIADKQQVYEAALQIMPEIKSGRLNIESAELSKEIARSNYYPSVSLNASVGTGHSTVGDDSFGTSLKNNLQEGISLGISIPIYSRRETRTAVRQAELDIETSRIGLASDEQALMQTVETYYLNALSSQRRYQAATENLASAEESYGYTEEQFNLGMKNTVELLTEKDSYLSAQLEQVQAKYMAILNRQMLNFYQGQEINL